MNNNKISSYLGAILGSLIGAIPWIFVYVYLGYILSVLAFVVAISSLKGYELLGGKKNKNTIFVIIVCSVVSITLSTFIFIPILVNLKNGLGININNLKLMYENNEFLSSIIGDYIISLLFTILGISGVIRSLKSEVDTQKLENNYKDEDKELIYNIFRNKNALDKTTAISRWDFEKEIDINKYNNLIKYLKNNGILVGNDKIYLDERSINDINYRNMKISKKRNKLIIIIVIVLILMSILLVISLDKPKSNFVNIEEKLDGYNEVNIKELAKYQLPSYLDIYEDNTTNDYYNENGYYSITYTPNLSYRGDIYFRTIYVDYIEDYYYDDFGDYKNKILNSSNDSYLVSSVNLIKNKNNLEIVEIKAKGKDDNLYYDYYTFYQGDSLFFEFICTNNYSDSILTEEIMKILNSVKYIKNNEKTY